jgi:hypothetical protein
MTPSFDEIDTARLALDEVWRQLAPVVDKARHTQLEVAARPKLQEEDPSVDALVRWLSIFDRELGAVQTVYEAANAGANLTPEEIYVARNIAEKLKGIIEAVPDPTLEAEAPTAAETEVGGG